MNAEQRETVWGTAESRAAASHQVRLDIDCAVGIAGGGASSAFPPQAFATTPAEASKPKANTFTKRRMF